MTRNKRLPMTRNKRLLELTKGTISDLVANFLYYDRKNDEELKAGDIEEIIKNGTITIDQIVEIFRTELTKGIIDG